MNPLRAPLEQIVRKGMRTLERGSLTVRFAGGEHTYGPGGSPSANITIHNPAFFSSVAFGGHIGAAESYVRGEWQAVDLANVVRLFAANRAVLDGLETGLARLSQPALAILRYLNRNTRGGSQKNISAHYDLGNDFFALFLDDTMTYSAGVFERPDATMKEASIAKYDRICQKLALTAADHVVEIGTGWGGFAIHAAGKYGCRVTTTTISKEQRALAIERVRAAGLDDRVTILNDDYRDLDGTFDKLVSIEMIEAVGHQYLDSYFDVCASLVRPGGACAIQAITILDDWYDPRQRQVDFIKKYIFPGSFIPSMEAIRTSSKRAGLALAHEEDITPHYAETLRRWRAKFAENERVIDAMGFDEEFRRLWEFYLCYCEGGFAEYVLRSKQLLFSIPDDAETWSQRAADAAVSLETTLEEVR
ncbi:MAG: cyclopropane-fatty-acyl-phospholipid synthase family protein [Gemmatimonadota bacterium]